MPYDFRASFSVLVGVWCLLMVVLGNAYTGNLMSCLVTPTYEPVANTLEEAAAMDIQVSVMAGSPLSASLLVSWIRYYGTSRIKKRSDFHVCRRLWVDQTKS